MKVAIHRGTQEIGGSCIELSAEDGSRIVLDLGRPLWAEHGFEVPLPAVPGFEGPDPSLLGVVISHPHLDHYGMVRQLHPEVPVFIGEEAERIVTAANFFSPMSSPIAASGHLRHGEPLVLGPFIITPQLNDHSAFDAYSLHVEADGRRLFYTGDFRGHGRKASLFDELLAHPPTDVDVLLMEGTHVRADGAHDVVDYPTESDLEDRFVDLARNTEGAVVVLGSAQNLDRLVTVYRAARRSGRQLVVDLYGATVAAATRPSIPQPGFPELRVYVPQRQRVAVKTAREFWRVAAVKPVRVFPEELAATPERFMFHVPSSTAWELSKQRALTNHGAVAWSLWSGYLSQRSGVALTSMLEGKQIPFQEIHTSGHASVKDLQRLVAAVAPGRVVPIHSEATERFSALFPNVEHHLDGEWWEV